MWNMIWPVLIIVLSNTFYHICTKSLPDGVDTFASLCICYLIASVICAIVFCVTKGINTLPAEVQKMNWTSFLLGVVIVGLEAGFIFLYRNGWNVNVGSIVCNIILAVVLVFVGFFLYKEKISIKQIGGIAFCSLGLIMLTM